MIFFRRRYTGRGFFSIASLIELFFSKIKIILILLLSILISGYFLIFYDLGGDYFINQGIIHKPKYVLKYMFYYMKLLFKNTDSIHIVDIIKFIFFIFLPYLLFSSVKYIFHFIIFFLHRKLEKKMPIFSAFLERFIGNKNIENNQNKKKSFFDNQVFKKKQSISNNTSNQKVNQDESNNINFRK